MRTAILVAICGISLAGGALATPAETLFYVAANGSDAWSGRRATPNAARTDGPLATLAGARDAVRRLRAGSAQSTPVKVLLRGGVYRIAGPVTFTPEDSGSETCPVTYAAAPGEKPVISGGRPITGWKKGAGNVWHALAPEARHRAWPFRQLWVGDRRAVLARSPNTGYYVMAGKAAPLKDAQTGKEVDRSATAFRCKPGEMRAWPNPNEINVRVFHVWETSVHPIASVEEATNTVTVTGRGTWAFFSQVQDQRYVVENHPGALDAPGEWQLDRETGIVSVIPLPGEDLAKTPVTAPVATQLVVLKGEAEAGRFVEHLHFEGISFQHAKWILPPGGHGDPQAAVGVEAAVMADGARACSFERCEMAHVGGYAVWFRHGCTGNRLVQCHVHDQGAGGVRIGETGRQEGAGATGGNTLENCFIHDGGSIHGGAHGVWVGQASDNVIAHNEICDFNYTGVSIGWSWGYAPTTCHRNRLEFNHIHHVGRRVLSDMGGIYTLGISTGTVIRNNLVHDCWGYDRFGSGGIYPDEGSTGITIENNVVYHTQNGGLAIHYGRDLTVRNNIFAFSRERQICRGRIDKDTNLTFERNIVLYDQGDLFAGTGKVTPDHNVYFRTAGEGIFFPDDLDLKAWQVQGMDAHSVTADPLFVDARRFDFRLREGSPALKMGFQPIDTRQCGLTGPADWVNLPRGIRRSPGDIPPPYVAKPLLVDDGFEGTAAGAPPEHAVRSGEKGGASLCVTDEVAAAGTHSLKFTDAPGMTHVFDPHLWYLPNLESGVATVAFDLRLGAGALAWVEWRDAAYPYRAGPSIRNDAEGQLLAGGKPVAKLPRDAWIHLEMTCGLGKDATGTWSLLAAVPGQSPVRVENLPCKTNFRKFEWLGFVSNATERAAFYVDDLRLSVTK